MRFPLIPSSLPWSFRKPCNLCNSVRDQFQAYDEIFVIIIPRFNLILLTPWHHLFSGCLLPLITQKKHIIFSWYPSDRSINCVQLKKAVMLIKPKDLCFITPWERWVQSKIVIGDFMTIILEHRYPRKICLTFFFAKKGRKGRCLLCSQILQYRGGEI